MTFDSKDGQLKKEHIVIRSFDTIKANTLANHSAIRPFVGPPSETPLDVSLIVKNPDNYFLLGEFGGVIFVHLQTGIYHAHTNITPEGRGPWGLSMVQESLKWMFCHTGAVEIMTHVPKGNYAARALAKAIGGVYEFTNRSIWIDNGQPISADIFRLTIQDWAMRAPGLAERGQWFHTRLESEFAKLGIAEEAHDDDETHDRYVGMACEMILGGQPQKGVIMYNRWAAMADYQQVMLLSQNPLAIDIRNSIVRVTPDGKDFYVLSGPPSVKH